MTEAEDEEWIQRMGSVETASVAVCGSGRLPRRARQYILLHPDDCEPPHGLDMTWGSRDYLKVMMLIKAFQEAGFNKDMPALVGYPLNGKIQLLSGTHRHCAAKQVNMFLPVRLLLRSLWESKWGTDFAAHALRDIPVKDLEFAIVPVGDLAAGIDDRLDLTRDMAPV